MRDRSPSRRRRFSPRSNGMRGCSRPPAVTRSTTSNAIGVWGGRSPPCPSHPWRQPHSSKVVRADPHHALPARLLPLSGEASLCPARVLVDDGAMTTAAVAEGRIGRYKLIKRLAVGGMADIFLAQEVGPRGYERTCVVKTIRADLVDEEDLIAMLMEEAHIASCLKHENIIELYEVGEEAGTHYLAMEFVFGRDLGQIRDRCLDLGQRLPYEHIITILSDVLDALFYAHHDATYQGKPLAVIHRDVSPQNVIIGFDGSVKLLDFGLAKAAAQLSRTRAGVLKGKYAYMSPEQVNFEKVDQRADIFSAGIVLWEMLTQRRLFYRPSEYETVKAVMACV